jgi:hypothetical protein
MKWLKLFESKYVDEYKTLKEKLGINEIQDDIRDVIQELVDDLDPKRMDIPQEIVKIIYKRSVKRKTGLNINYYDKFKEEDRMLSDDFTTLLNFIEFLNFAEKINYVYKQWFLINLEKEDFEKKIKTIFSTTQKRINSLGYDFIILNKSMDLWYVYDWIDNIKKNEESINQFIEEEIKYAQYQVGESREAYIYVISNIESNASKIKIDKTPLPTHLQTKFDEFVKKNRLSTAAQKELIDWFKN